MTPKRNGDHREEVAIPEPSATTQDSRQDTAPTPERKGSPYLSGNTARTREYGQSSESVAPSMPADAPASAPVDRNAPRPSSAIEQGQKSTTARSGDPLIGWHSLGKGVKPKPAGSFRRGRR